MWFPFHPFPFTHTFVSSFLSCPPVFTSFISSFSSFACTLVPALVCTCTSTYLLTQVQVAQVFTMRWASSGVPAHLVPLSFQPHAPLSRLVFLSCLHSFVLCAHACTLVLTLAFRLPSGRRVCVCVPLVVTGILLNCFSQQGRVALSSYHTQRSCGREWEGKLGQFPVPAVENPSTAKAVSFFVVQ